ncbi:hypothetical protein [Leifsonia sp. C5G2]|uniref:hypothetical protein n=1 Tax=Leifsonia sp. C5G2 TaxID=2735269 RepID=UPI0015849948|nr:hypothetical protein [Leifsonia sp. C5G2]NUU06417.1 hypothetical protein [Leifsonia sp. C5G2]
MTNHDLLPADEHFHQLKLRVLDTIAVGERRRTRKHRLIAMGIAGTLALGTTAGAIAIARASQGQINYLMDCYASADLDSRHATSVYLPGDQSSKTPTPLSERVTLAEDMCAATWRIGSFSPGGSTSDREFPVPDLQTCQLPDGRLGVFPSELAASELCTRLGLASPHE